MTKLDGLNVYLMNVSSVDELLTNGGFRIVTSMDQGELGAFFFENHDRRVQFCKMHAGIKQSFADAGESTGSQQEKIFRNHTLVLLQNFVNDFGVKYVTHDVKRAYLDWRLHFALPRGIDCPMYQFPQHHRCTDAEKQRMASRVELYRGLF